MTATKKLVFIEHLLYTLNSWILGLKSLVLYLGKTLTPGFLIRTAFLHTLISNFEPAEGVNGFKERPQVHTENCRVSCV